MNRWGYFFVLPTLVLFGIFLIYPLINCFSLSFFEWNLVGPKVFVGLKNYFRLFQDSRFWHSYWVTLHFTFLSVAFLLVVSFWLALPLSNPSLRYRHFLQSLIFLPVVLSVVGIAVVWKFMFQSTGLLSVFFTNILGLAVPWLSSVKMAPYSVILVYVWKYTGYYMVMFIAGLLNIPSVYYEAAIIDGAGFWSRLVHITLPLLRNTIILVFVSCVLFSFGSFALQYVLTEGGPSRSTETLALLIYREGFKNTKFGYSAAISLLFFVSLLVFSIIQNRVLRSQVEAL